jgi:hypothetical protein
MSSSSKRKRLPRNPHAAQFEVIRAPTSTPQPSATSRTVVFDRHVSGRLGQHTEISEVSISAEDIATLAQDPEFSSWPDDDTLNFGYFEQVIQEGDKNDEAVNPEEDIGKGKGKEKVKPVCVDSPWLCDFVD